MKAEATEQITLDFSNQCHKKHSIPEIYINYTKFPNKLAYNLLFDITKNNRRYTLYVLKDWKIKEKLKPFLTQQEWRNIPFNIKRWYIQNPDKRGKYLFYKLMHIDPSVYIIKRNPPIQLDKIHVEKNLIIRKLKKFSSISEKPYTTGDVDRFRKDQPKISTTYKLKYTNMPNYTGPLVSRYKLPVIANKLYVMIPLNKDIILKKLLYKYPNVNLVKKGSKQMDAIWVRTYIIKVPIEFVDVIAEEIKKAQIALEIRTVKDLATITGPKLYRAKPLMR